ncbi:MAG: hypothetical protein ACREBD_39370 [Blastocatellia bacterium]
MPTSDLTTRLEREFTPAQAQALATELEAAHEAWLKASDLTELKDIVRDLGLSQQRSDAKIQSLSETMESLAEQQKRTDAEMAEQRKRTDAEMAEQRRLTDATFRETMEAQRQMQQAIEKLTLAQLRAEGAIQSMRQEVGGMANSLGYQLENEAYRRLPKFLAGKHNIRVTSRVIREQVGDEEINVLAEGARGKAPVLIVGEAKSRLAAKDVTQLKRKIKEVEKYYPAAHGREIVPMMVVHFAREKELQRAEREGVIVVQSFEWSGRFRI